MTVVMECRGVLGLQVLVVRSQSWFNPATRCCRHLGWARTLFPMCLAGHQRHPANLCGVLTNTYEPLGAKGVEFFGRFIFPSSLS
jgi:hypothetical protein